MQWVKANERLPKKNEDVYIRFLDKKKGIKDSGHWDGETFWSHHYDYLNSLEGEELKMVEWLDESPLPSNEDELWEEVMDYINEQGYYDKEVLKMKYCLTRKTH